MDNKIDLKQSKSDEEEDDSMGSSSEFIGIEPQIKTYKSLSGKFDQVIKSLRLYKMKNYKQISISIESSIHNVDLSPLYFSLQKAKSTRVISIKAEKPQSENNFPGSWQFVNQNTISNIQYLRSKAQNLNTLDIFSKNHMEQQYKFILNQKKLQSLHLIPLVESKVLVARRLFPQLRVLDVYDESLQFIRARYLTNLETLNIAIARVINMYDFICVTQFSENFGRYFKKLKELQIYSVSPSNKTCFLLPLIEIVQNLRENKKRKKFKLLLKQNMKQELKELPLQLREILPKRYTVKIF